MMGPQTVFPASLFHHSVSMIAPHRPCGGTDVLITVALICIGGLAPYHSTTGRPSTAPELLIRMLLAGYC